MALPAALDALLAEQLNAELNEAELAMCRLFGGFPADFFAAYDAAWPPAPGRDERIPLYQLYHLLNHLNLFGEGYGGQVDSILRRNA
jgi:fructosamine-3-kinase